MLFEGRVHDDAGLYQSIHPLLYPDIDESIDFIVDQSLLVYDVL